MEVLSTNCTNSADGLPFPDSTDQKNMQQESEAGIETDRNGPTFDNSDQGIGNRKQAWAEELSIKDKLIIADKSDEERIKALLAYIEDERRKNKQENAKRGGVYGFIAFYLCFF